MVALYSGCWASLPCCGPIRNPSICSANPAACSCPRKWKLPLTSCSSPMPLPTRLETLIEAQIDLIQLSSLAMKGTRACTSWQKRSILRWSRKVWALPLPFRIKTWQAGILQVQSLSMMRSHPPFPWLSWTVQARQVAFSRCLQHELLCITLFADASYITMTCSKYKGANTVASWLLNHTHLCWVRCCEPPRTLLRRIWPSSLQRTSLLAALI